jgi:hypothetical protein
MKTPRRYAAQAIERFIAKYGGVRQHEKLDFAA